MSLTQSISIGFKLPRWANLLGVESQLKDYKTRTFIEVPNIRVTYQKAYPYFMKLLGVEELNQYWYEVIRRCITTCLHDKLERPIRVVLDSCGEKEHWRMINFPLDQRYGEDSAKAGAQYFRQHYEQIKQRIK